MKNLFLFVLFIFSLSFLTAQTSFYYDESGNRIERVIILSQQQPARVSTVEKNPDSVLADQSMYSGRDHSEELENSAFEQVYTDKLNESDILIYPNPTQGMLAVKIREGHNQVPHQLSVFAVKGVIVFQRSNVSSYTEIDLSAQPKGMYMLRISSRESFITWKIIKE